jgi:Sulfotransferase family
MRPQVDFLGIGAQKAATSWLYQNLRQHPDIWMPPRKELHYFDRSTAYPSSNDLASEKLADRLFGRQDYNKGFVNRLVRGVSRGIIERSWANIRWTTRYFLGTYNDDWYRSLFKSGTGKVKGEITPSYSILSLKDVNHIREMFPELKVILILRNPIDRAWSHVRFDWIRLAFDGPGQLDKIKKFIDDPDQSLRSDYVRTLEIWRSCFPKQQIFVGFYEDVIEKPEEVLRNICQFLDVSVFSDVQVLNKRVNVSRAHDMPKEIRLYLAEKYNGELRQLNDLFGGPCKTWLEENEKILGTATQRVAHVGMIPAGAAPGD